MGDIVIGLTLEQVLANAYSGDDAKAAIAVLESSGYEVISPSDKASGRKHAATDEVLKVLKEAQVAIASLDNDVFGLEPGELYWYRNALLERMEAAIALADGDKEEE